MRRVSVLAMAQRLAEANDRRGGAARSVSAEELRMRLDAGGATRPVVIVDVREEDEFRIGHIPGAMLVPERHLAKQIEKRVPDRTHDVFVYCAQGTRSQCAAKTLVSLGYESVAHVVCGFARWQGLGFAVEHESGLAGEQRERYSRHLLLPEVGEQGQARLLRARVLLVGAGGLGSSAALYLAGAGIGRLGLVDADTVDVSNLHRQILHGTSRVGMAKVESGHIAIRDLNPDVDVVEFRERLTNQNVDRILGESWDVIVDGCDNFPTRYLVCDASLRHAVPVVHGSVFRFQGQVTTFVPHQGPCYRCLYPAPPPADLLPSCGRAGVLGVLPGLVGTLLATEAIKLILGRGNPLVGRLITYDSLSMEFRTLKVRRDRTCAACGENPTITRCVDYESFCAGS